MSGHSKWATIKRKKGVADAKRGQVFTKLIRELTTAARAAGGNPDMNPRLRLAIDKAKQSNMPGDNIQRAIKKGTGDLEGQTYEESTIEGYGPGGAAVVAQLLTDNRNRTLADMRHIFSKNGGNLGTAGCVMWVFSKKGWLSFGKQGTDEEKLLEVALDAGAEDLKDEDETLDVVCDPTTYPAVKDAVEKAGFKPLESSVTMIPQNTVKLTGHNAEQMLKLMEALEEHDDVQTVYSNFDISKEEMERVASAA